MRASRITWQSDFSVTRRGWKICGTGSSLLSVNATNTMGGEEEAEAGVQEAEAGPPPVCCHFHCDDPAGGTKDEFVSYAPGTDCIVNTASEGCSDHTEVPLTACFEHPEPSLLSVKAKDTMGGEEEAEADVCCHFHCDDPEGGTKDEFERFAAGTDCTLNTGSEGCSDHTEVPLFLCG
jgi:hypothetical protein